MIRALALACAVAILVPALARADGEMPERVRVAIEECDAQPLDPALVVERLRVELTTDGVGEVDAGPADETGVDLAHVLISLEPCAAGAAVFEIRIDDLVTRKRVERTIDLSSTPDGSRIRALALAVAELLRASWAELTIQESPSDAPPAIVRSIRARVVVPPLSRGLSDPSELSPSSLETPERAPRTAVGAAFVVRSLAGARTTPLGGRLFLDLVPIPELTIRVDAEVGAAVSLDPLGRIEIGAASLGLTLALAIPIGEMILLTIGPRIAAGVAWASGSAYEPTTIEGAGAGPIVALGGAIELDIAPFGPGFSVRAGVGAEGMAVGFEARARGVAVAGISGGAIGVWIGLAIEP